MGVWHEDDAFWEEMGPFVFPQSRWEQAPADVERAVALLELPAGAAVLDVPCGPGRHALELARRGFRVTGVDRTRGYLDEARRRAASETLDVEWVEADMREFRRESAYAAVVNLLTSFGYFDDPADDVRVAEHFFASLQPGGRLLMDLMSKEVLSRIFRERDWREEEGGTLFLEERSVSRDWSWIDVRWIAIRGAQRREHRFGHRLFSATELVALLTGVGFRAITVCGGLGGEPYDHRAERLVVLARKPAR